jgi:WD40 repeat protein
VRLWDVASGAPIGTLDNGAWVTSVVFKPDDPSVLVSAGLDGAVWQWDVSLATWQQRACVIAGRDLTEQEWHRYVGDEPYRSTCSTLVGGR